MSFKIFSETPNLKSIILNAKTEFRICPEQNIKKMKNPGKSAHAYTCTERVYTTRQTASEWNRAFAITIFKLIHHIKNTKSHSENT